VVAGEKRKRRHGYRRRGERGEKCGVMGGERQGRRGGVGKRGREV